ncbi:hypothetical protein M2135_000592 [Parabacteroides sp. PF5-9]|nr:hypothetical protein [Parabacteroides sp. PF5-9]
MFLIIGKIKLLINSYLCARIKNRTIMITSDQLHNVLEREQALRGYL